MNLFVARLNSSTTAKDLQKLFSHNGLVTTVKIIYDQDTGQSKRYGFVEMPNNHEAHEAIKELDETAFQENIISVRESRSSDSGTKLGDVRFQHRNSSADLSRNNNSQQNKNNPYSINRTNREGNSLRNFGYRGGGYSSFR